MKAPRIGDLVVYDLANEVPEDFKRVLGMDVTGEVIRLDNVNGHALVKFGNMAPVWLLEGSLTAVGKSKGDWTQTAKGVAYFTRPW